jgi:hypothetical protein
MSIHHEEGIDELRQSRDDVEGRQSSQPHGTDCHEVTTVKNGLIEMLTKLAELATESTSDGELVSDPGDDSEKPQTDLVKVSDEDLEDCSFGRDLVLNETEQ